MGVLAWLGQDQAERCLGAPFSELQQIAETAERHYRRQLVEVNGKERRLLIPRPQLRRLQGSICKKILARVSPHHAAYCCRGKGALQAATAHLRHPYLLHLDIAAFFPSVTPDRVNDTWRRLGISPVVAHVLAGLTTVYGQLPQGASTSVGIGNLVLYPLDCRIAGLCRREGLTYTRYVDDIAISGGKRLKRVQRTVSKIVIDEGWRTNDKGGLLGPDRRHRYVGIVINTRPNVDPSYISDLYRLQRTLAKTERKLSGLGARQLMGRLNYVRYVNPPVGEKLLAAFRPLLDD